MCEDSNSENNNALQIRRRDIVNLSTMLPNRSRCFFDKMVLRIKGIALRANSPRAFSRLKASLGNGLATNVFSVTNNTRNPNSATSNYINLSIRNPFLYQGKITLKRPSRNDLNINMEMELSLNPARFIAHMSRREAFSGADAFERIAEDGSLSLLRIYQEDAHHIAQHELRRGDNHFSINVPLFQHSDTVDITWLYIRKVLQHILDTMTRTGFLTVSDATNAYLAENDIHLTPRSSCASEHVALTGTLNNWTLHDTEVACDISMQNAPVFLHETALYWSRLFRDYTANHYDLNDTRPINEREFNEVSISGSRRNNVSFAVYSKTAHRLRLETRYANRSLRSIHHEQPYQRRMRAIAADLSGLPLFLSELMDASASSLASLITELPEFMREGQTRPEPVSYHQYASFLQALHSAIMQPFHFARLLRRNDAIEAEVYNEAYAYILNACMTNGSVMVHKDNDRGAVHYIMREALGHLSPEYFTMRERHYGNNALHHIYLLKPEYVETLHRIASAFDQPETSS